MIISWRKHTMTGSAEPVFGDSITSAFSGLPNPDNNNLYTLAVGDSSLYQEGFRILLGAGSAGATVLNVEKIIDSTHIGVSSPFNQAPKAWGSGTIIALDMPCAQIWIQGQDGNAASIWIGTDNTVTNAGGGSAFREIQKVATSGIPDKFDIANDGPGPNNNSTLLWMAGTASDHALIGCRIT
jgi:hypothetical protein